MGVDADPFPMGLSTNMVSFNMRGMPRKSPKPKVSLGEPSRHAQGPVYENSTLEEEAGRPHRVMKVEQWPSRWNKPIMEIKKFFQPRCSMVCNECGQTVELARPQLRSVVIRTPEGRLDQRLDIQGRLIVFSRLQSGRDEGGRYISEPVASSSLERRPMAVKPKNTPPDEWFRAEHPKFPCTKSTFVQVAETALPGSGRPPETLKKSQAWGRSQRKVNMKAQDL